MLKNIILVHTILGEPLPITQIREYGEEKLQALVGTEPSFAIDMMCKGDTARPRGKTQLIYHVWVLDPLKTVV